MDTQTNISAIDEALRRRAALPPSSAGIGAADTNSLAPTNPIANAGSTGLMTNPTLPSMAGGADGAPSGGATNRIKQDKGEARTILDALIFRLKRLPSDQGAPVTA